MPLARSSAAAATPAASPTAAVAVLPPSASSAQAAGTIPAASVLPRPRPLPPACRFRREDGSVKVACTPCSELVSATASAPTPAAPVLFAGAASGVLLSASVASANGDDVGCEEELAVTLPVNAKCIVVGMGDELTSAPRAVLWASTDDDDEEELAPQTSSAATKALDSGGMCVGHDADTSEGWQEVLLRRGPRRPTSSPSSTMAPHPIPAWLRGRCCRCLAHGHRAADCKDPLRCSRCLENGHRARGCRNPWRPLSSLPCLDVPPVSRLGAVHPPAPASCEGPMRSALPSKALHRGSWASIVSATAGSTTSSELMLQSALADQTALLQDCVARVGSFLERAEAALSRRSLVPAMLQTSPTSHSACATGVCSAEDRGVELYGSFSPRVGDNSSSMPTSPPMLSSTEGESIAVLVAPVLQIMPELRELCRLSVEHLKVDTSVTSSEGQDSPLSSEQLEVPILDDGKGRRPRFHDG